MGRPTALAIIAWQPTNSLADKRGNLHRTRLFVSALDRLGFQVTMAHLVPPEFKRAHDGDAALEALQSAYWGVPVSLRLIARGQRTETFFNHYVEGIARAHAQPGLHWFAGPEQAAAVAALIDERPWDLVHVTRLPAMVALARSGRRPPVTFFDLDDVDHRVRARTALLPPLWPGKLAYLAHVPALLAAELRGIARSKRTFVCSELDRRILARFGFSGRVATVPNALPVPADPPPLPGEPTLMFLGPLEHLPNVAGAVRLATRILPLVRREVPEARALIAGDGSKALAAQLGNPANVEFLGFVPDLPALYARSRVVCCAIETGGGTRLKLVEAASYARPMVATRIGAEGLDFADGEEILLHDTDEAIAAACVRLLRDAALCERLGAAARARMRERFDAEAIIPRIADLMRPFLPADIAARAR